METFTKGIFFFLLETKLTAQSHKITKYYFEMTLVEKKFCEDENFMHIGLLMKQVPKVMKTGADGLMDRSGSSMINPYCKHSLEEAVKLKQTAITLHEQADISIFSMGPPNFEQSLRQGVAIGADNMILLSDRKLAGSDTMATAKAVARLIQNYEKEVGWKFDVFFAGLQTVDGDTAHVPSQVAERLGYNQITYVEKVDYLPQEKSLKVQRIIERGYMVVKTPFPVMLSVTNVANVPRGPSLAGLMKARGSKLEHYTKVPLIVKGADFLGYNADEIGLAGSPTVVASIKNVEETRPPIKFSSGAHAKELVENALKLMESDTNVTTGS